MIGLVAASGCSTDAGTPPATSAGTPDTVAPGTDAPAPGTDAPTTTSAGPAPSSPPALGEPAEVATGLDVPWGIAFLPDGDALVTERDAGRILRLAPGGSPTELITVEGVDATGEAGLLGLAVAPDHAEDGLVYAYLTTSDDNRVVRFDLADPTNLEVVLDGIQRAAIHDGGRIAFGPDGMLYVSTGDAGQGELAQDPASLNGKILRLLPDGGIPADNPDPESPVYSLGHRNVQGLAWDDQDRLWATELGASTADELNLIRPGANYGWPEVEGEGEGGAGGAGTGDAGGFTDPVLTWSPSEASPSGLASWRGALHVAALRGEQLWQVPVGSGGGTSPGEVDVGEPVSVIEDRGRLRSAVVAPDGSLWVATGNTDGRGQVRAGDDRILRFGGG